MCGIIGFIGGGDASKIIVDGLEKLEYRGYDSAGFTVLKGDSFATHKTTKRIAALKQKAILGGKLGIGHTRWATHGEATVENAHPHFSSSRKFAVVHNGIIENYQELRRELEAEGVVFRSDTDSEVVPLLLERFYKRSLKAALIKTLKKLKGSFALAIICSDLPDTLIGVRKQSPLLIGRGKGQSLLASDKNALPENTNGYLPLEDGEFVLLREDRFELFNFEGKSLERKILPFEAPFKAAGKEGYSHYMLKEIYEQPAVIKNLIKKYVRGEKISFSGKLFSAESLKAVKQLRFVACGSAYNAAMAAKYLFEELIGIPVFVDIASEYRYNTAPCNNKTLVVAVSQSGETADTLAALKKASREGARTLAVVNVEDSSLDRLADCSLYTAAGPEIAVATTKGWSTQVCLLYLLAIYWAETCGIKTALAKSLLTEIKTIPKKIEQILKQDKEIKAVAKEIQNCPSVFFIGRNTDFAASLEASLKLKEITYIHSEAYPSGELKHGTISLIEENTPVFALCCCERLSDKQLSNVREVTARKGKVFCFATKENAAAFAKEVKTLTLPRCNPLISPLLEVIPFQLLAFRAAYYKGLDIDKPRNLAKSVTVE